MSDDNAGTKVIGTVTGLLAAAAALGAAELTAALRVRWVSPVYSVGSWVIDHAPPWAKTFAVRRFGTNDKPALLIGTLVLLAVFAAAVGVMARRRRWIGAAGIALFGALGAAAALSRPTSTFVDVVPSVVGAAAGYAALTVLFRTADSPRSDEAASTDRRRFLTAGVATAALAVTSGGVGRFLRHRFSVAEARRSIVLPRPSSPATTPPADTEIAISGITPWRTTNADFYRVDTALFVPQIKPSTWMLRVHGMVDKPLTYTYDDLLSMPLVERDLTLVCVSNEVGGTYAGNARWLGVPLAEILRAAGVRPDADQLVSRSVDGWTAGTPLTEALDGRDAMVAIGMNGEPLPLAHGFPARLLVPGLYGFVSATKWLTELELSTFAAFDPYWARRGWAKRAPIKTMSRIDTPRGLAGVPSGPTPIAGVAWAPHRGISAVEVRVDDGGWMPARLAGDGSKDTWRQWVFDWDATPGSHTLSCRAADGTGEFQTDQRVAPIPDGATGWHSIVVTVG